MKAYLFEAARPFLKIAPRTGRDHVLPAGDAASRARDHVVKRQLALRAAVLAAKLIAQKQVESGERDLLLRLNVVFQNHHGRDTNFG